MEQERKPNTKEKGQALLLVLVAASLFLFAALGLALDASQLYAQRGMAQAAADAAAQAAALSVRDSRNTAAYNNAFGSASLTCGTGSPPSLTPCYYAWLNGFSKDAGDTVQVDFPTSVPRVSGLDTTYTPNVISVTITRPIKASLLRFIGVSSGKVVGHATAALLVPTASVPFVLTGAYVQDALDMDNSTLVVTGGPTTSIQVNSCGGDTGCSGGAAESMTSHGGATVNLQNAGPSGGGGGYLGNWGKLDSPGSPLPSSWLNPPTHYTDPSSPLPDPLANIAAPTTTGRPTMSAGATNTTLGKPNPCIVKSTTPYNACQTLDGVTFTGLGCNATPDGLALSATTCTLYYPGVYDTTHFPNGITPTGTAVFAPGLYYIQGAGFVSATTGGPGGGGANVQMANGMGANSETGVGATFYNANATGVFDLRNDATTYLTGDTYGTFGMAVFFENRAITGTPLVHYMNGSGGPTKIVGVIYISMGANATATKYNRVHIQGIAAVNDFTGGIVVDAALTGGPGSNQAININLTNWGRPVTQVALVQ